MLSTLGSRFQQLSEMNAVFSSTLQMMTEAQKGETTCPST